MITQTRLVTAQTRLGWLVTAEHGRSYTDTMQLDNVVEVGESREVDRSIVYNRTMQYTVHAHSQTNRVVNARFFSQAQAQKFSQILRAAIEQAKATTASAAAQLTVSPEERLRRLTQLHKEGLISEEEFQQKRRAILGEL